MAWKPSVLWTKSVRSSRGANLKYSEYLDVLPNPTTTIVDECAAQYKAAGCTAIIALGGGSPMDVAKAVGVVAKFGGTIGDYEGVGKVPGPIDTLIAVPTTAGTGSEVTVARCYHRRSS